MEINSAISKNKADNDKTQFLYYLNALKEDGLIDDFIDLDDITKSRFKSNEKRPDFLVKIGEFSIVIELKSRILGHWNNEEEVIKKIDSIRNINDFVQLLKKFWWFKDMGKDGSYRDSIWVDLKTKTASLWQKRRRSEAKKQLKRATYKYGDVYCMVVYSHSFLPFFIDHNNGTNLLVPSNLSKHLENEGIPLFDEVQVPVSIFRKHNPLQILLWLIVHENPWLGKSSDRLPPLNSECKELVTIVAVKDNEDLTEAVFDYNNRFRIKNSCKNPLPKEIIKKLTRDERDINISKIGDNYFTFFYPENKNQTIGNKAFPKLKEWLELEDIEKWKREEALKAIEELQVKGFWPTKL